MMTRRTCAVACLTAVMAACGGSGSETPPPVEPTTPGDWEHTPATSQPAQGEAPATRVETSAPPQPIGDEAEGADDTN